MHGGFTLQLYCGNQRKQPPGCHFSYPALQSTLSPRLRGNSSSLRFGKKSKVFKYVMWSYLEIRSSLFLFFCFWSLLATKLWKYYITFVYILQGKLGKKGKKITQLKWPRYQKQKVKNMGWTYIVRKCVKIILGRCKYLMILRFCFSMTVVC